MSPSNIAVGETGEAQMFFHEHSVGYRMGVGEMGSQIYYGADVRDFSPGQGCPKMTEDLHHLIPYCGNLWNPFLW